MRVLRVIDSGLAPAGLNTAASLALLQSRQRDTKKDFLRFYGFEACVLLGRSQDAKHIELAHCRRLGLQVARRITGGGAVYMCPSMLAWDFVTGTSGSHAHLSEAIGRAIAGALASIGIAAQFRAPNDLILSGRKLSGAATTTLGQSFLHQGTLLVDDECDDMADALGVPLAALRTGVTSLTEAGCARDRAKIVASITASLAQTFQLTPVDWRFQAHEIAAAERDLAEDIGLEIEAIRG